LSANLCSRLVRRSLWRKSRFSGITCSLTVALYIEILSARRRDTERRLIPLPDPYSLVDSRCGADSDDVANLRSYIHLLIHPATKIGGQAQRHREHRVCYFFLPRIFTDLHRFYILFICAYLRLSVLPR